MLATRRISRLPRSLACQRYLNTESLPTSNNTYPPPPAETTHNHRLPQLPPTFGRNQLLPVTDSTRALLESIVDGFDAPIRYAFAYGSGVFEQDGQTADKKPMLDFIPLPLDKYAPVPSHYPLHARTLGSDYVSRFQSIAPGVWFNAYVPSHGVTIKYGVTTVDNLCSDLLNWDSLYLAGRMHKPLRIIKDDARVRLNQQVNLVSAVRAALLTLPQQFTERELYERIAGISYAGDPRMVLPAENRGKVGNIVRKQEAQFHELYRRLVVGLPGVHWGQNGIEQDMSALAREKHLRKLPKKLLDSIRRQRSLDTDDAWAQVAGDASLPQMLQKEMASIVRWPATVQTAKGVLSAGPAKSIKYAYAKLSKWWQGTGQ
ncbi:Mmp37-domain-containing protein [Mucidula mucida]|nr:Mmp37-domain-containing protein [Mucidula mucida]